MMFKKHMYKQMVEHKLVSFVTVIALWTLATLLTKLIRILLNTYKTKPMLFWPLSCEIKAVQFVKNVSSCSPG